MSPETSSKTEQSTWTLSMSCGDGGSEAVEVSPDINWDECQERTESWVRDGDWGTEGALVSCSWNLTDTEGEEIMEGGGDVEIEPSHDALIAQACGGKWDDRTERCCGTDPDDHDWTDGKTWSSGGTTFSSVCHCRTCGLSCRTVNHGSQRNPGQHDTVEYTMPETWCEECEAEECRYPLARTMLYSECEDEAPDGELLGTHETEEEAREAARAEAHERCSKEVFVALDDRDGGDVEYDVYIL